MGLAGHLLIYPPDSGSEDQTSPDSPEAGPDGKAKKASREQGEAYQVWY